MVLSSKSFCEKLHDASPCTELYSSELRRDINKVANILNFNNCVSNSLEMPVTNGPHTTYTISLKRDDSVVIVIYRPSGKHDRSIYLNGDFNGTGFEIEFKYNKQWIKIAYSISISRNDLYIVVESVTSGRVKCTLYKKNKEGFLKKKGTPEDRIVDFDGVLHWFREFITNPEEKFDELRENKDNSGKRISKA